MGGTEGFEIGDAQLSQETAVSATIIAERGAWSMTAISPKAMPAENVARRLRCPAQPETTLTNPLARKNSASASSPH
jgi:hypothetical protein